MVEYLFNPELVSVAQQPLVKALLNATTLEGKPIAQSDCLLGSSTGRGTTWFIHTTPELGVDAVLRHYYRGGLFGKLIKDRYCFNGFEKTRAVKEYRLLNQMYAWGLPVPRPIAVKITCALGTYQADMLVEKIAETQDLSQYLQQQRLSQEEYVAIGRLIRRLHDHQVHHADLNIHNILREKTSGRFWLIDFDKCAIQPGESWKSRNLARLQRSFEKERVRLQIVFEPADFVALIHGYDSGYKRS